MTDLIREPSQGLCVGQAQCFNVQDIPAGLDYAVLVDKLIQTDADPVIDRLDGGRFCVSIPEGSDPATYLINVHVGNAEQLAAL